MASRRQEKVARVVKESVSDAINNRLSDPRIEGFISVTRVDISPDLKKADVYLSIFGTDEKKQNITFEAIKHAHSKIQSIVVRNITGKFSPSLNFKMDENFKKTLETLNIIENAVKETDIEE